MAVTKELEKVGAQVVSALRNGSISWNELLDVLSPDVPSAGETPVPVVKPITGDMRAAIDALPAVYGSVAPDVRRTMTDDELYALMGEREVLKSVEQLVKDRANDVRTYILNHADLMAEAEGLSKTAMREKDGHYAVARRIVVPESDMEWSIEPREGAASLDVMLLKALADSDDVPDFNHDDYLAMTKQTRMFDEDKTLKLLADRPELVDVIQRATLRGKPSVTVTVRKQKKS
jgi:hypothetical protein